MGVRGTYKVSGIPLADRLTQGNAYFVDSNYGLDNVGTGYGHRPDRPFATVDYAINQCASGDTIYVMERHAETISSTAALVPDVPKISIIGAGFSHTRPVITLDSTGAADKIVGITGAGTRISNIIFRAGDQGGSSGASLYIGADSITIDNCQFDASSSSMYHNYTIQIADGSDKTRISNNFFINNGTTGDECAIYMDTTNTGSKFTMIDNNMMVGKYSKSVILGTSASSFRNIIVANNVICNNSTVGTDYGIDIDTTQVTARSGIIVSNIVALNSTGAAVAAIQYGTLRAIDNTYCLSTGLLGDSSGIRSS